MIGVEAVGAELVCAEMAIAESLFFSFFFFWPVCAFFSSSFSSFFFFFSLLFLIGIYPAPGGYSRWVGGRGGGQSHGGAHVWPLLPVQSPHDRRPAGMHRAQHRFVSTNHHPISFGPEQIMSHGAFEVSCPKEVRYGPKPPKLIAQIP